MRYDNGEINEVGDNLEVAWSAEITEIRLVDRLRAVRARVNTIPSELEVEIQTADVMNDESELGPDLMQYESGRRNMKAKRVKLTVPVRLTSSGNRATTKRIKRKGRKYGRSDRMVLDFGDIDLEEAADGSERVGWKKARFHAFNLRRLGHNGRRLRFSRPNADIASGRDQRRWAGAGWHITGGSYFELVNSYSKVPHKIGQ
jgi:hypothetical protein